MANRDAWQARTRTGLAKILHGFGSGVTATPAAVSLQPEVHAALERLERSLDASTAEAARLELVARELHEVVEELRVRTAASTSERSPLVLDLTEKAPSTHVADASSVAI